MKTPTIIQKLIKKLSTIALKTAGFVSKHVKPETGKKILAFGLGVFMVGSMAGCANDATTDTNNFADGSDTSIVETEESVDYEQLYKDLIAGIGNLTEQLEDINSSIKENDGVDNYADVEAKLATLSQKYAELNDLIKTVASQEIVNGVIADIASIETEIEKMLADISGLKVDNSDSFIEEIKELSANYKKIIAKEMITGAINRILASGYYSFNFDGMSIVSAPNGDYAWINDKNDCVIYADGIEHCNYNNSIHAEYNTEAGLIELIPGYLNMDQEIVSAAIENTVITLNYAGEDNLKVYMDNRGEILAVSLTEGGVQKYTSVNEIEKVDYQNRVDIIAANASTYNLHNFITERIEESYQEAPCLNEKYVFNDQDTGLYQMIDGINKTFGKISDSQYAVFENGVTTVYKVEADGTVSVDDYNQPATICTVDALMRSLNYTLFRPEYKFVAEYDDANNKYVVKSYYNKADGYEQEVYLTFDENNKLVEFDVFDSNSGEKMHYSFEVVTRTEFYNKFEEVKNMILDARNELTDNSINNVE